VKPADEAELVLLRQAVSSLETRLEALGLRVACLDDDLGELEGRMSEVEAEGRQTAAEVDGLTDAVGNAERDTERAHERISSLEAEGTDLEARVDALEGDQEAAAVPGDGQGGTDGGTGAS
jgi:chromosome segregation ATPase